MLILLPIRTNVRPWRTPYANYALIISNVIIFILTYWPHRNPFLGTIGVLRPWATKFMLTPLQPHYWQFVTYAFLHGSLIHIIGNMYFLYLFGNNVNDKLGHIGYLAFYLAGAIVSGIGHTIMSTSSVLGASGAVAAVTGAYLVVYPQTLITVLYWVLFFIGTIDISALYFIGFKLIFWDNIVERRMPNVAYGAHLSGYAFGILATLGLFATGLISSRSMDLWSMIKRWNQRRRYRDVVSSGHDPFPGTQARQIKAKEIKRTTEKEEKIQRLRSEIASRITERNLSAAAKVFLELIKIDSKQVLPQQHLLDIANQLASENKSAEAAQAYEQFLAHYKNYEYSEQVQLMLGILYSRYLKKPLPALKYLQAAAEKLSDPAQIKMCRQELARLQN